MALPRRKTPAITGQAEAGVMVKVFNGNLLLGQTNADTSGFLAVYTLYSPSRWELCDYGAGN